MLIQSAVSPARMPGTVKGQVKRQAQCATLHFSGSFMGVPARPQAISLYFCGAQRKLMSYNAERFVRSHPNEDIGSLKAKNLKSIEALAAIILKESPDVIALQEVGDEQLLREFNRRFLHGQYPNVVSLPTRNPNAIRVAVMSKADIRVVEAKSHWQEQCGSEPDCGKRDFLETTFETHTGYRFTVYNAHFKSMGRQEKGRRISDEAGTAPTRMKEAATAARILNRHFQREPQARLFVTGDINTKHFTSYGKPVLDTLTMVNDQNPDNDLTEVMLKDGKPKPTYHGGSQFGNLKLDYTFASKAMLRDVKSVYVVGRFKRPWKTASDHLPIVTVFEEPDPKPSEGKKAALNTAPRNTLRRRLNRIA